MPVMTECCTIEEFIDKIKSYNDRIKLTRLFIPTNLNENGEIIIQNTREDIKNHPLSIMVKRRTKMAIPINDVYSTIEFDKNAQNLYANLNSIKVYLSGFKNQVSFEKEAYIEYLIDYE